MESKYIISNPQILGGKPIIKNSRISVEFIQELVASGGTIGSILAAYPHLEPEAIKEAIEYPTFHKS